jgi:cytochrome oxidase Cu insertion factor (SCO1/SenC/PrrC family)
VSSRADRLIRAATTVVALLLTCASASASTEPLPLLPDESRYINQSFPDIIIRTTEGERSLSGLWHEGPLLLTLVFTRCAGVCSPYLRAFEAADAQLGAPTDIRRVVLSFDPRDTVEDMQKTAAHLTLSGRPDWTFSIATPEDIGRVLRAAGFWFTWDAAREQFDHPAMHPRGPHRAPARRRHDHGRATGRGASGSARTIRRQLSHPRERAVPLLRVRPGDRPLDAQLGSSAAHRPGRRRCGGDATALRPRSAEREAHSRVTGAIATARIDKFVHTSRRVPRSIVIE